MTHPFHSAYRALPDGGGVLNVGQTEIVINLLNLAVFVAAIGDVEAQRVHDDPQAPQHTHAVRPEVIEGSNWSRVTYVAERNTYAVTFLGVSWETSVPVAIAAAAEAKAYLEPNQ
ncbi:hypothetical protein [Xanthomonas vasicola]|uniref:Uncharacterized protein n=1 Tax=Xanthomonas vasicola pv. vasculorum NCPPB 890 TaxID=1184265 RepID=A0A836P3M2_XANVA|nr:hypothetical protein [Xanthomonas vasicola]MBV6747233.1 hypothetical protein [Xanthomonas vasicola pv. vasculorum NCPPB 890]MBV6892697.1 hypothetical protein [Xanthomonas vasicola pv. vasculorum]MDO6948378.1 hypothetical protein [Xanthomonas vasicola]MDO6960447.1 hypothetical protein [Xanthomonas vasicola]